MKVYSFEISVLLVYSPTLYLVVVTVTTFGTEVGVVALEDLMEDFVVQGDEEIVLCFGVGNDLLCQLASLREVGLACIEASAFDGTWRNIQYAVFRASHLWRHRWQRRVMT